MPVGLGGLGVGKNPFSGGGGSSGGPTMADFLGLIDQYSYKPQYTGQTEKSLFDLFQNLTGQGGKGVEGIPFDIGLPTTGLYDALTRGIKEDYLGTPGGPEGGRIADTRAYYNNMGIPEYALNQERLANRDLNNTLTDTAAKLNETQKDRLLNVLGLGSGIGENLYGQNLAQHRANAGMALQAAGMDAGIQESIRSANQSSLTDLLSGVGSVLGTIYGGPAGGAAANYTINNLFGNTPTSGQVTRSGGASSALPYFLPSGNLNSAKLLK